MRRSTPAAIFFSKKKELLLLLSVLAAVALLYSPKPSPRVTISGLHLEDTRESVHSRLTAEEFERFSVNQWEEHWHKSEHRGLNVVYDDRGRVHSIKGGVPRLDGEDVSGWTLDEIRRRLGQPAGTGSGREVGGSSHGFLSYPELRLLVQRGETTTFVLFRKS